MQRRDPTAALSQRSQVLDRTLYQVLYLLRQYAEPQHRPKLYSLHEPEMACIANGKTRTPYQFSSELHVITTAPEGFVLHCQALRGNPYKIATRSMRAWRGHHHYG